MSEHGGAHDRSTCCALHVVLVLPVVVLGILWVLGFVEVALLALGPLLNREKLSGDWNRRRRGP